MVVSWFRLCYKEDLNCQYKLVSNWLIVPKHILRMYKEPVKSIFEDITATVLGNTDSNTMRTLTQ